MDLNSGVGGSAEFRCPACGSTFPQAWFCGVCGAPTASHQNRLRPATFAVAPRERLEWPMLTSSMFPHLPERYRIPFRHGLFLVVVMLVAFSALRLLGPLVIVVSLGTPLLFGMYVWRSNAVTDISALALAMSTVLGAGVGAAWWLWTGTKIAAAYNIPLGAASQIQTALGTGLIVSLAGAVLMLLPLVAVRMMRLPARESLDGFLIGALGALAYSAAATIVWLAPQFVAGLLDNYGPARLFEEAILYGFSDPLTGAAAGGTAGLALWFRPARREGRSPRHVRAFLWALAAVSIVLYMGIYFVDAAELPRYWEIGVNALITAAALVVVRIAVQAALLYEAPDPATLIRVRCEHCEQTVPDMPFCPECGAATRALSRSARQLRRRLAGPVAAGEGG